ncbi:MAG: hypothetical protein GY757_15210, partial [bacterium]|nr:hypothetical protein [bacterium]
SKIHKEFNVKLPLTEIFKNASIRTLADTIKEYSQEKYISIETAEKKEYYDLSSAQKRLFILQQMEPASTVYNMPYVIPLMETVSREKLEETFGKLIARHESLRTAFRMINGTLVQKIQKNVEFKIERKKKHQKEENQTKQYPQEFFRPFDLASAPLLRVGIVETTETDTNTNTKRTKSGGSVHTAHTVHDVHPVHNGHTSFMLIDMHHIISDG